MPSLNFLLLLLCLHFADSIVNPNQQTANIVIYMRKPNELGPRTWHAGVHCLDKFTKVYFQQREHLTRSYNMVLTSAINMSTPAAQIQDGYLKLINEAVSEQPPTRELFQLRIVSDAKPYIRYKMSQRELLLADYYVIIVDSVARLQILMHDYVSHMISWNPGARFLVLYNNVHERHLEEQIAEDIFSELLDNFYVHRVAVLYAIGDTEYSFVVMNYLNKVACRTKSLRRIGLCRDGNPYPNKEVVDSSMNDYFSSITLENCTFFMCAAIAAPFVEKDCSTGIELRLVAFIKNRLGFNIHQTCQQEARGVLETSGNWSGLLGQLNDQNCDFILGGFYPDNDVTESFWTSDCYLYDSHTWYVKLADPRPAWRALYSIFENETWLCFILVLFITWFFWWFFVNMLPEVDHMKEISLAGIHTMAVSICVAVNEQPKCNASRVFFLALSLYGLNVVSTYTSKLIAVFTDPGYLHQIDTIDEVAEAGIPFGGPKESRDWFENDDDMWIFDRYNDSLFFDPNSENLLAVKRGERVILSSRMYILQNNISDDIFAFSKNVFSSSLQMIMKPGFPFLYEINVLIRQMRDMGIFGKIDTDFRYNNTYLNRIAKMRPEYQEEVIVLTTEHLEGPFAILIVGICGSTVAFMCELLVYWLLGPFVRNRCGWKLGKKSGSRPVKEMTKAQHKEKLRMKRKARDTKKTKRKGTLLETVKSDDIPTYNINVMRSIRFTPVKRRRIVIK